jgi:hypothetical protein
MLLIAVRHMVGLKKNQISSSSFQCTNKQLLRQANILIAHFGTGSRTFLKNRHNLSSILLFTDRFENKNTAWKNH